MKKIFLVIASVVLFGACAASVGPHGSYVAVAPPLPAIVELVVPYSYYVHGGFHYYYHGDRWYYSRERGGRLKALPRDRYPGELMFKDRRDRRIWKEDRSRGRDRGRRDDRRGRERDRRYR